jgi:hypothetical protein
MSNNIFDLSLTQDLSESQTFPETFKCTKCENHFPVTDRDNHELFCLYSLEDKSKDIDDIPCEKCGKIVSFDDYTSHSNMCGLDQSFINDIYMNIRMESQVSYTPPYSYTRAVKDANKILKNDSEQTQKRSKKSNSEDDIASSTMTSFFQHIGNILGNTKKSENIISTFDDEPEINTDVIETYSNTDSYDEQIEEPTIEPSYINDDDDINELDSFEMTMQSFHETYQSNRDETKPYYETNVTPPLSLSSSTIEEPIESKLSITASDESFKFSLHPEIPYESKEPKNNDDTKDNSTNENKYLHQYENANNHLLRPSSFNINSETLSSGLYSTHQSPTENNDNELEDVEFPKLPIPVNLRHSSELNKLQKYLSTRTYLDFTGQRRRRNAIPNIRSYISSYGSYSSELFPSLPYDLKAMMEIVNTSHSLYPTNYYVPYKMRQYNDEENESYEELKSLCERTGVVELGVSNMDAVAPFTHLEDGKACVICDTDDSKKKYRKLICDHSDIFCDDCVTKWLSKNRTCPVCTKNLEDYYISMMSENELSTIEKELGLTEDSDKTFI